MIKQKQVGIFIFVSTSHEYVFFGTILETAIVYAQCPRMAHSLSVGDFTVIAQQLVRKHINCQIMYDTYQDVLVFIGMAGRHIYKSSLAHRLFYIVPMAPSMFQTTI